MFNPKKEVPSLELCKKLKELGYSQEGGGWYWISFGEEYNLFFQTELEFDEKGKIWGVHTEAGLSEPFDYVKAPTVRELGEWLPDFTASFKEQTWWECHTNIWLEKDKKHTVEVNNTEANARAKMLIWLVENNYINFKREVNHE